MLPNPGEAALERARLFSSRIPSGEVASYDEPDRLFPELSRVSRAQEVSVDQAAADLEEKKVAEEEAVVKQQAKNVMLLHEEAQRDLDVAMPALEAAIGLWIASTA